MRLSTLHTTMLENANKYITQLLTSTNWRERERSVQSLEKLMPMFDYLTSRLKSRARKLRHPHVTTGDVWRAITTRLMLVAGLLPFRALSVSTSCRFFEPRVLPSATLADSWRDFSDILFRLGTNFSSDPVFCIQHHSESYTLRRLARFYPKQYQLPRLLQGGQSHTAVSTWSTISLRSRCTATCPRAFVCRQNSAPDETRPASSGRASSRSPTRRPLRQPCERVWKSRASNIWWRADSTDNSFCTSTSEYKHEREIRHETPF